MVNNKFLGSLIGFYQDNRDIEKYESVDITSISPVLTELTLLFMQRCYEYTREFDSYYRKNPKAYAKNKKYYEVMNLVTEQLDNMQKVQASFLNYFTKPDSKTKGELFTFIYAHQINRKLYYVLLYKVIYDSLKQDYNPEDWSNYFGAINNPYNAYLLSYQPLYLYRGHIYCIETSPVPLKGDTDISLGTDIINKYAPNQEEKLELVKQISDTILSDYSHHPYKSSVTNLVNAIKAYNTTNISFSKK